MQRRLTIRVPADLPVSCKHVFDDHEHVGKQIWLHLPLLARDLNKHAGLTLHDPALDANAYHRASYVAPCAPEVGAGPGACAVHQLHLAKPKQPWTHGEDRQRSYCKQDVDENLLPEPQVVCTHTITQGPLSEGCPCLGTETGKRRLTVVLVSLILHLLSLRKKLPSFSRCRGSPGGIAET